MTRISKKEYEFSDMQIAIEGKTALLEAWVEISYTEKEDKRYRHTRSKKPYAIQGGVREYPVELTILQSEFEALQRSIPKGSSLLDKTWNITVAYAPADGAKTIDQIIGLDIQEYKKGMKTGDGDQEIILKGIALDLKMNI